MSALESCFRLQLGLGETQAVVRDLRPLVELHSDRESLSELLMLTLYRLGRQSEALAVYHQLRGRLCRELGVDPCKQVQRVHQMILSQDDALLGSVVRVGQ